MLATSSCACFGSIEGLFQPRRGILSHSLTDTPVQHACPSTSRGLFCSYRFTKARQQAKFRAFQTHRATTTGLPNDMGRLLQCCVPLRFSQHPSEPPPTDAPVGKHTHSRAINFYELPFFSAAKTTGTVESRGGWRGRKSPSPKYSCREPYIRFKFFFERKYRKNGQAYEVFSNSPKDALYERIKQL